jgi:hypothetical protein
MHGFVQMVIEKADAEGRRSHVNMQEPSENGSRDRGDGGADGPPALETVCRAGDGSSACGRSVQGRAAEVSRSMTTPEMA